MLIGLSEDPLRYEENGYTPGLLASGHREFEQRFGMPFGTAVKPRMWGTSRACRAVIAAREAGPGLGYAALRALQLVQFTTADLLDDDAALHGAVGDLRSPRGPGDRGRWLPALRGR